MRQKSTFPLLLLLIAMAFPSSGVAKRQDKETLPDCSLLQYISKAGNNLDCHFTVEFLRADWMSPSLLEIERLPDTTAKAKTVDDLIDALTKYLPNAVIWKDKDNPEIVHIVDRGLSKMPKYGMTKVGKFTYQGDLSQLPNKLGAGWRIPLREISGGDINLLSVLDFSTKIQLRTKKESVRSILSNHISPDQRMPILWLSTTLSAPQAMTEVIFFRRK